MRDQVLTYFGYDGETELPEEGVAIYNGSPHYFWLRDYLPEPRRAVFDIAPIDPPLLRVVSEYEALWRQWDFAYHAGSVELSTHPSVHGNNPRFVELQEHISARAKELRKVARPQHGLIELSEGYVADARRHAGKKWPIPGMRSA